MSPHKYSLAICALFVLLLSACNLGASVSEATATTLGTLPPAEQSTTAAAAVVATVNGEAITRESYNLHLAQYQAALTEAGTLLATENVEQIVVDDLINRMLLAQGARTQAFSANDTVVEERMSKVVENAGGQVAFEEWMTEQGYTAESFRGELALEIEAGWMRNEITAAVPTTAEQVLARQILLNESFQAERLLEQLENGTPFEQVVVNNDPQRLGTLGWFPRGYLLQSAVEEAAFALQPGEFSQVIETELGFHLVEVLDRDPARPLNPQARLALQTKALEDWLEAQRAQSAIEIFLP
ncbi:MAG: peptidylprolyl isomerase [Anaerolineales bacterium]